MLGMQSIYHHWGLILSWFRLIAFNHKNDTNGESFDKCIFGLSPGGLPAFDLISTRVSAMQ